MRICLLLERGSPPRVNPVVAEAMALLEGRGLQVAATYPEEELLRLDGLSVEADLYLLKSNTELALSYAVALEHLGARVVNACSASALAKNKVLAAAVLHHAGIRTPRSLVAGSPALLAPLLAEGALILKPHRGHYGRGIAVAATADDLAQAGAYPDLVFAQRYLARARTDLKLFAIGEEIYGVRKPFGPDSFRAAGEPVRLTAELEALARRCGDAFGLQLYGLDIAEDEDGPWVVDVNSFPGYRGVPDAPTRLAEYIGNALGVPGR